MSDDPFAEPGDTEGTVIRPRPRGGMTGAAGAGLAPEPPPPQPAPGLPTVLAPAIGTSPLLAAAAPLLAAAVRIGDSRARHPNPDQLRRNMVEAVRDFETCALATGMDTRSLRAARYALCATIDDLVLSTPWGGASSWTQQGLTSIFHQEVTGGDRFFEILEQMQRDLGRHAEVVELMYLCLSLGFEGRYRVMQRGIAAQAELRDGIYRTIRQRRGEFERNLSGRWRGIDAGHRPLLQRVPLWAIGLGTLVFAILIYLGFNFSLAGSSDSAYAQLQTMPPATVAAVPRPEQRAAPPPPPPPPPAAPSSLAATLHKFLEPEIQQGLVTVIEDQQAVTVRLTNRSMFASGAADLAANYLPLLGRIGEALQTEPGQVTINGYTDNQPIRTVRFPSNFQLSQARADAVAKVIQPKLTDPGRVHATGKADADPIETNATPEGRQANRRIEIVLVRQPTTP